MSEVQRNGIYALTIMGGISLFGVLGGLGILGYALFSQSAKLERNRREERSHLRTIAYNWADENNNRVLEQDEMIKFANELGVLAADDVVLLSDLEKVIKGGSLEDFNRYIDKKAKERREQEEKK